MSLRTTIKAGVLKDLITEGVLNTISMTVLSQFLNWMATGI